MAARLSKTYLSPWTRSRPFHLLTPALLALATTSAHAQATGASPWENAVNALKTSFTGPIATGLSLVAIVIGGLMFAYGEGQSKKPWPGSSSASAWRSAR